MREMDVGMRGWEERGVQRGCFALGRWEMRV